MLWLLLMLMLLIPCLAGTLIWWETRAHATTAQAAEVAPAEGVAAD